MKPVTSRRWFSSCWPEPIGDATSSLGQLRRRVRTPLSALLGVLINQWLTRRTAKEIDARSKREELMRNLRWAAELASATEERKSELGVAQLVALGESDLLDAAGQGFIDAALASVIREPTDEIEEIEASGESAEVVEDIGNDLLIGDQAPVVLPSESIDVEEETSREQG